MRRGAFAGLILVAVVIVGVAAYTFLAGELPGQKAQDPGRVLVIAATTDDSGAKVAQVIAFVDSSSTPPAVDSVDPWATVSIPGTNYTALRDAYPFGGGQAVAEAYAGGHGSEKLPYLAIGEPQLIMAVDDAGGMVVNVPAEINVFDGEKLYTWLPGETTVDGAGLVAMLKGAPYLTEAERGDLLQSVSEGVVRLLGSWEGGLAAAAEHEGLETDLSPDAAVEFEHRLAAGR